MRQLTALAAAASITFATGTALAQSKTVPGESRTVTATVEAIEKSTRQITLKNEDGTYEVLTVPPDVKRFDSLKVGDRIKANYYANIVLRLKQPGEKDVDTTTRGVTPGTGVATAGTVASQRTITATITAIDPAVPSITFKGPNGWTYSSRVEDKAALAKVKEGDKVDITWTKAAIVSIDDVK